MNGLTPQEPDADGDERGAQDEPPESRREDHAEDDHQPRQDAHQPQHRAGASSSAHMETPPFAAGSLLYPMPKAVVLLKFFLLPVRNALGDLVQPLVAAVALRGDFSHLQRLTHGALRLPEMGAVVKAAPPDVRPELPKGTLQILATDRLDEIHLEGGKARRVQFDGNLFHHHRKDV